MKVRCIKLTNAFGEPVFDTKGNPAQSDGWLTVGKDYHVLEVLLDSGEWSLRIMNDEGGTPALFPLANFEIVSPRISPTWIVRWGENGYFELTPEAWQLMNFGNSISIRTLGHGAFLKMKMKEIKLLLLIHKGG
jgi:hypothetical protein